MYLTQSQKHAIEGLANLLGLDDDPERLVKDAIRARVVGQATEQADQILDAADIEFFAFGVWAQKERPMNADQAYAVLKQAKRDETYDGPIPKDDETALAEAAALVEMAEQAWEQYVRGPEVEAILRLAKEEFSGNGTPDEEQAEIDQTPHMEESQSEPDEPWNNYSSDKVADIKTEIQALIEDYSPDKAREVLLGVRDYENTHEPRVRVLKYVEEGLKKIDEKEQQIPKAEADSQGETPQGSGETEDAAPVGSGGEKRRDEEDDQGDSPSPSGDAEAQPSGEADEPGEEDRPGKHEAEAPEEDRGDSDYLDLVKAAESEIQRLHKPSSPPPDQQELPFDLTTLSDKQLQQAYSAFTAYAYRAGYLLTIEESKARKCRAAADELARAKLVSLPKYDDHDKPKTMTILEAEVERDPEVSKWRRRQHKHEAFSNAYRQERDSYTRVVDSLSRLESMRHQEWERSGGGRRR